MGVLPVGMPLTVVGRSLTDSAEALFSDCGLVIAGVLPTFNIHTYNNKKTSWQIVNFNLITFSLVIRRQILLSRLTKLSSQVIGKLIRIRERVIKSIFYIFLVPFYFVS